MENRILLYLSIASSIIGLGILYFASEHVELSVKLTGDITYDDIGKNAKVCGRISSLFTSKNNHVFLKVEDKSGEIDLVVFNKSVEKLGVENLKKGDNICATGKIDEYNDKLEIIPTEIRLV